MREKIKTIIICMLLLTTMFLSSVIIITDYKNEEDKIKTDEVITNLQRDNVILSLKLQHEIDKDSEYKSLWLNAEASADFYQNELRSNPYVVYVEKKIYVDNVIYKTIPLLKYKICFKNMSECDVIEKSKI